MLVLMMWEVIFENNLMDGILNSVVGEEGERFLDEQRVEIRVPSSNKDIKERNS